MKGCVVERARPSNCIDIYPLIKEAAKEGVFYGPKPGEKSMKEYYYKLLMHELPHEGNFYYLAKRGKGYLGCLHAILLPNRWDGSIGTLWVDFIFVREYRRKMGVGRKLIDALQKDADRLGIKSFEFLVPDDQVARWTKEVGAVKTSVLMRSTSATV